jgi:hypothetical protein
MNRTALQLLFSSMHCIILLLELVGFIDFPHIVSVALSLITFGY